MLSFALNMMGTPSSYYSGFQNTEMHGPLAAQLDRWESVMMCMFS